MWGVHFLCSYSCNNDIRLIHQLQAPRYVHVTSDFHDTKKLWICESEMVINGTFWSGVERDIEGEN